MLSKKQINQEIALNDSFKQVVLTYEEIYLKRMKQVKDSVIKTRTFINEIASIFTELKRIYQAQLYFSSNKDNLLPISKSKPAVAVLITGNKIFSGEINAKVLDLFINHIKRSACDIVIIGKLGKDMYEQRRINKTYTYFDLDEEIDDIKEVAGIANFLIHYQRVDVFFGKFVNLIEQTQSQSNITGDIPLRPQDLNYNLQSYYLFEPSLKEILSFFEIEIFRSLFNQTLRESYLAQLGSRINSLQDSKDHISREFKNLNFQKYKINRQIKNKSQLERISYIL